MNEALNLSVVPPSPCGIDFAWYEEIRDGLLRRTVGQAERVLDVGCGPGNVLLMLAEQIGEGIGIDISEEFLEQAGRARQEQGVTNVAFRHADATALPFPDGDFDVVLLLGDVLSYLDPSKHEVVVAELRRVLREGGIVVHESMNWTWEYRWPYPPSNIAFTRSGADSFTLQRIRRTASGLETSRDYAVLPATPLHRWILAQEWPVCESPGANTWLEAQENAPIPKEWLRFVGVSRHKHYRPRDLERLYKRAEFRRAEAIAYGQTYDLAQKAGLLEQIDPFRSALAAAEAEVAFTLRLGSGPWLFMIADK
jgi:ubiquinone/menaquinone biosynthesis C-methylase UbiE